MSAFKNLLKSDTPSSSEGGNSGRVEGQGSHFPRSDNAATQPTTVTGTEPNTAGPSDISAAPAPAEQAQATAGPEAGGSSHIGTVSASEAPAAGNSAAQTSATQAPTTSSSEFPSVESSKGESGSAAIGSTTTYSSQPLASGDPTGSVIDHRSTDPLTYKLPEAGSSDKGTIGNSGVTSDAAATAASVAWKNNNDTTEIMPGGYPTTPGYENPYKASHALDPRVDGGKASDAPTNTATHTSHSPSTGLGPSGVGEGAAAAGATAALKAHEHDHTGPAPSTLTTTADPADRSAEYSRSTDLKGLGSDPPVEDQSQSSGFLTKALGAVGLGGAAAALGLAGENKEGATEPHDQSAVATQPGVTSQESGPPKHYRRESIPTTAYPGGLNSPAAVAPPVGGTQPQSGSQDHRDNLARDGALAAGVGGGAIAASDLGRSQEQNENVTGYQTGASQPSAALGLRHGAGTAGVSSLPHQDNQGLRDNTIAGTGGATVHDLTTTERPEDSHTGRDAAAIGATSAAVGTGAYALHEHNKDAAAPEAVTPVTHAPTTDASSSSFPAGTSSTAPVIAAPSTAAAEPVDPVKYAHNTSVAGETAPTAGTTTTLPDRTREAEPTSEDHTARNAALGAGAGAAAVGLTTHVVEKRDSDNRALAAERARQAEFQKMHEQQLAKDAERSRDDHTGRDAALGAGAGAAVVGGAAYAADDRDKDAEKEAHKHQTEAEKEEKKHAKEAEKAERKHEKELQKEEKHHQKELEKEKKHHDAELAAAAKRDEARRIDEDEVRMRHEREAAAAAGAGGVAAGAYEAGEHDKKEKEKEKKPNIFKRIFKRRKNKDTGEDEDYSTDDDSEKARRSLEAARVVAERDHARESRVPHHDSEAKGRTVLGKEPRRSTELPVEPRTGMPYDPAKDPEAAARLQAGNYEGATTSGLGDNSTTLGSSGLESKSVDQPGVTSEAQHGVVDTPAGGHLPTTATEPFGEIGDHHR